MSSNSPAVIALPPWGVMWGLALAIYMIAKLTAFMATNRRNVAIWRQVAFLLAWPGMDGRAFLNGIVPLHQRPTAAESLFAVGKFSIGLSLLAFARSTSAISNRYLLGWTGMVGIALTLHFGLFHLLSCFWRTRGVLAVPIMDWPIVAESLSDFWGRRWNRAFRDLTHEFIFRPLSRRMGAGSALMIGFLISGLVHDLVISVPAGGGYGGPTFYFLLQGVGITLEKWCRGHALEISHGITGRLFCAAMVLFPCPWLFPDAFLDNVIIPFVREAGAFR